MMIKKITAIAAAAVLCLSVFAQESKTSIATQGIFGNDVDDYTSVNYWSNVKPKSYFAYFGMGNDSFNRATYDFGFAKEFKKFYWGTYYSGNLGSTTTTKTTAGGTTTKIHSTGDSDFVFNNTFGFGNVGLGIDFHYINTNASDTATTTNKIEDVNFAVRAGLKEYKIKTTKIIPFAMLDFNIFGSKSVTTIGGTTTTNDSRNWILGLTAGADIPFGKAKDVEQTLSVAAAMTLTKPTDSDVDTSNFEFTIPVGYKAVVKASNELSLGFKAEVAPSIGNAKAGSASTFSFGLTPSVAAALTYATKKNIDLNAGVNFAVPSFSYTSNDAGSRASWNGDDASLGFSSGFAIKPTKNICIDCSYEILADLFGTDTTTDFTSSNFWNTVNDVLVHNIGFEVSVKF